MKQPIRFLLLLFFLSQINIACFTSMPRHVVAQDLTTETFDRITHVTLTDGTMIEFDEEGGKVKRTPELILYGTDYDRVYYEIRLNEIAELTVERKEFSPAGTVSAAISITIGSLILLRMILSEYEPPPPVDPGFHASSRRGHPFLSAPMSLTDLLFVEGGDRV